MVKEYVTQRSVEILESKLRRELDKLTKKVSQIESILDSLIETEFD